MPPDFLDTLAHVHDLPMPAVQSVAASVAERCAVIANRYESGAIAQASHPGPVGAHIGAAILAEFALREGGCPVPEARPCAPSPDPGHAQRCP